MVGILNSAKYDTDSACTYRYNPLDHTDSACTYRYNPLENNDEACTYS